ncbi:conserved Plasmodium protein, unknown function [Plasmodium berghei]|uniref:Uncharacterized protein n=1 Tax=Plasmodium berghei TaxID=5821 RepID=A0A1D3SI96_PLABE|nr:conserved Plasmodium protein, unknown function [Plasmodium berghei]
MDVENKKQNDKNYIKNTYKHFCVCNNKLISQSLYICQFCKIKCLLNSKKNHERNLGKSLYANDIYKLKFISNSNHKNYYFNNNKNICYKNKCTNIKHDNNNDQLINLKKNRHNYQINNKPSMPLRSLIQKTENKYVTNTNVNKNINLNYNTTPNNIRNNIFQQLFKNGYLHKTYKIKIKKLQNNIVKCNKNNNINSNSFNFNINKTYNNIKCFIISPKISDNQNNQSNNLYNYKIYKKNNKCVYYNNLSYSNKISSNYFDNYLNFKNRLTNKFHKRVECRKINNYNDVCKVKNFEKNFCCRNYSLNYNSFFNIEKDTNSENKQFDKCMKYNKVKEKVCYIDLLLNGEKEAQKIIGKAYKHKANIKKYMYKNIDEEIEKLKKKEILIYEENLKKMEKEIDIYQNQIEKNLQNYILKINDIYKNIDDISKYLIDKIIKVDLTFNSDLLKYYLPVKDIEQYIYTNSGKM